jgi:uncharacterized protein YwgA
MDRLVRQLDPSDFVLAIVASCPDQRVKGKKRLQKFAYLLKSVGAPCDAEFRIWDFGPYSRDLAGAAEHLATFGYIRESEEQVGQLKMFTTVYSLVDAADCDKALDNKYAKVLEKLDSYSNVDLEVAATIQFYLKAGCSQKDAEAKTKLLKPSKALPPIVERCNSLLKEIEGIH